MNKTRTKFLIKGFTLIELVIVMAIFGILLIAVISIAQPVSRIFRNSEASEKTYAYSNNIQTYIQNQLEYVDNIQVITEDKLSQNPTQLAEAFRVKYYKDIVAKDSSVNKDINASKYLEGNIYVLRLANHDGVSGNAADIVADDGAGNVELVRKGQIYLYEYSFESNTEITTAVTPVPQLNDAYFEAGDAKYVLNYALGSHTLTNVDNPISNSTERFRAIANDIPDGDGNDILLPALGSNGLTISVIASKELTTAEDYIFENDANYASFKVFKTPVSISTANVPLLNISFRANGSTSAVHMVRRWQKKLYVQYIDTNGTPSDTSDDTVVAKQPPSLNALTNALIDPITGNSIDGSNTISGQDLYNALSVGDISKNYKIGNGYEIELQSGSAASFVADVYDTIDATKDIYFVYAYADELTT